MMIYDEPSANLDVRSRRRLIRFIQSSPQTLFVASHDLELILEVCDRVILLVRGQIAADGTPDKTMSDVALMEAHSLERPHSLAPHAGASHYQRSVQAAPIEPEASGRHRSPLAVGRGGEARPDIRPRLLL